MGKRAGGGGSVAAGRIQRTWGGAERAKSDFSTISRLYPVLGCVIRNLPEKEAHCLATESSFPGRCHFESSAMTSLEVVPKAGNFRMMPCNFMAGLLGHGILISGRWVWELTWRTLHDMNVRYFPTAWLGGRLTDGG